MANTEIKAEPQKNVNGTEETMAERAIGNHISKLHDQRVDERSHTPR